MTIKWYENLDTDLYTYLGRKAFKVDTVNAEQRHCVKNALFMYVYSNSGFNLSEENALQVITTHAIWKGLIKP